MSSIDVEALLDESAAAKAKANESKESSSSPRPDRRERGSRRDDRYERRRRDPSRERGRRDEEDYISLAGADSPGGSHSGDRRRRRSRSRGYSPEPRGSGDHYRPGDRGARRRSRSPVDDRSYRPSDREDRRSHERERYRDRDYDRERRDRRRRSRSPRRRRTRSITPPANEDEIDSRTIFVQQLANRVKEKDLFRFFDERAGAVKNATIVKDRVSLRSKGVGYVEFYEKDSVPKAIELTGQKLKGIPIIAQQSDAAKNRQSRNGTTGQAGSTGAPFHRLYIGNIHFSITEENLSAVFGEFGTLEFVTLQKDETGRSKGFGFIQFEDAQAAKEALEAMNGFQLAGRPIRVGLGNDKYNAENAPNMPNRSKGPDFVGSAFSGAGGRGQHAGGTGNFDRPAGRDTDRGYGASALDDTDVGGVNFNNYSRDALMRKLARTDDPAPAAAKRLEQPKVKALPINIPQASRNVVLKHMFGDPDVEEKEHGETWRKDLADEIKEELDNLGRVVSIHVDPTSTEGAVYVKFDKVEGGEKAMKGLNGRHFGGRVVTVDYVSDAMFQVFQRGST